MRGFWLLMLAACDRTPRTTWVTTTPERVAIEARAATASGLVPVLYRDAPFTVASTNLVKWRGTPEMRRALDGIAVIEIAWDDGAPFLWHSFEALDASGGRTGAMLQPQTKDGPCTGDVAECAAWIEPFARSLRR